MRTRPGGQGWSQGARPQGVYYILYKNTHKGGTKVGNDCNEKYPQKEGHKVGVREAPF